MVLDRNKTSRRIFLKKTSVVAGGATFGAQALSASAAQSTPGANEKIRLGFIGVGNRGSQLLASFMKNPDMQVAALCDVYEPYLERDRSQVDKSMLESVGEFVPKMGERFDGEVSRYKDFRKILERKDIDAVVIATPDHWHAIQTVMACEAGKDVYVEKPLSVTVEEGRKMVEAVRKYKRVSQVGLHRRSSKLYAEVGKLIRDGKIGKVTVARTYHISNMYPNGIGRLPDTSPPAGLDWDLWLGPHKFQPYKNNIPPYKFRWWLGYSSQLGNWGVHYFDAIRWVLGQEAPVSISAHGGRFALDDDRTITDTLEVIFEFPAKSLLVFGLYEASGGTALAQGEIEFRGTLGNLYTGTEADGYSVFPSRNGQFQNVRSPLKPETVKRLDDEDLTDQHTRNFLDCVKSRNPCNCDIETGHRSTSFVHLANIALATKSRIEWDAAKEQITNHQEANSLLHTEYREPWKLG